MEALAIGALLVLPGAWLTFALRDGAADFRVRLAWALALSPLVAAAEFFLARRATGAFPQTAWLVATLNAPALILIWRRWRARIPSIYESSEWEIWRSVLVYLAVAACVALPWWLDPAFRIYSWHSLLQLDVIYAIAAFGTPGEAELAGASLTHPWAPHVTWALEAAAAEKSPTLLYPINNLLLLAASGVLAYALARALGASKAAATAATALLALAPNAPELAGWSPPGARRTPLALEFVSFDATPYGIALLLGIALAAVELVKRPRRQEMLLMGTALVALGALQPSLYPAGAALAAAAVAALARKARQDEGLRIQAIDGAGWAAAGLAAGYFVIESYSAHRATSPVSWTPLSELASKALFAALSLGPFAAAAYGLWRDRPDRRSELKALAVGAGGAVVCFLTLRLPGFEEYKLLMAAGMLLAAPAVLGLCEWAPAFRQRAGWLTLGSIAALGATAVSYSRTRLPKHAPEALSVDERGFYLLPGSRNRNARWMTAVRVKCEPEAVLVIDRSEIHVSAFTARRLLVASDRNGAHAGCNRSSRSNLVELRGHDPNVVDRRLALLERVYRPPKELTPEECAATLTAIRAEAGPDLAFVFLPGDDRAFLEWLRNDHGVRTIFDDGERTVVEP